MTTWSLLLSYISTVSKDRSKEDGPSNLQGVKSTGLLCPFLHPSPPPPIPSPPFAASLSSSAWSEAFSHPRCAPQAVTVLKERRVHRERVGPFTMQQLLWEGTKTKPLETSEKAAFPRSQLDDRRRRGFSPHLSSFYVSKDVLWKQKLYLIKCQH